MATRVEEVTWEDFRDALKRTDAAVVPVAALEPHGTHGPLGFDNFIAEEVASRLAEASGALLLPSVKFGCLALTYDIRDWPGALSLSVETLTNLYTEIGTELARFGVRRIVFVNGHGPNTSILEIAAYKIWTATGTAVGVLDWWSGAPKESSAMKGYSHGTHADQVETSILMATKGSRFIKMARAKRGPVPGDPSLSPEEWEMYVDKIKFTRKLDKRWIGRSGNYEDPSKARRQVGEKIVAATVKRGLRLMKVLERNTVEREGMGDSR